MILTLDTFAGVPFATQTAFETLGVQIGAGWEKEHAGQGNHTFITHRGLSVSADGVLSPAQIIAHTNNYEPVGLSMARVLRLSTNAALNLTGIKAPSKNQYLDLWNIGAQNLVLEHASASSAQVNRFGCPGAANFTLNAGDGVGIWYDLLSHLWRVKGF